MSVIYKKRLNINSKYRTNGSSSSFSVIEPNYIKLFDNVNNYKISLSVLNCVIPYSFFNVNNNNNKFELTESDADGFTNLTSKIFEIPEGNYDVILFRNTILTLINSWIRDSPAVAFNYTFDFDRSTTAFNLTTTDLNKQFKISFLMNNSAYLLFGFEDSTIITALYPIVNIKSVNVIQLSGDHQVYVKTSLMTDTTTNHNNTLPTTELISIPIDVPNFHLLIYKKMTEDDEIILQASAVDNFTLYLTNENNQPIDLRGLNWEIKLLFKIIKI